MSLIADALKKAQSSRLGRRYATPEPSGVLPAGAADRRLQRAASFRAILGRLNLSPTVMIGTGSGVLLFIVLLAYFFYGRSPGMRSARVAFPPVEGRRTAPVISAPELSAPPVEPVELEERGPAVASAETEEAAVEESPPTQTSGKARPEKRRLARLQRAPEPAKRAPAESESSKVAITTDPSEEVRYHFNLALRYQEEGNLPLARRTYEKVVQMWPLYAEAHNNLGVVYKELAMHEQAIAELNKALALNPRYARAYHNLGVVYQTQGEWRQAIKSYETALSLDRNHPTSYNNLGLVYRSQKRPHDARQVLEKALALNPAFPQTHYNLALVLEEIGEMERARFHYQKFIDLSGDDHSRIVERVRAHLQEWAAR